MTVLSSPVEHARHRVGWLLIGLALLLIVLNIVLALRLSSLISQNYQGCQYGNVLRADARLILREGGHAGLAAAPELRERPCEDLYGNGFLP